MNQMINQQNLPILKKKTSRRKKSIRTDEFNLDEYKEKIMAELSNSNKFSQNGLKNSRKMKISNCEEYERLYRKYMEVFRN